tara:strand:- start:4960 stop:6156 length:1197 start_codon:yes stop_codon:yes gene_type:complete
MPRSQVAAGTPRYCPKGVTPSIVDLRGGEDGKKLVPQSEYAEFLEERGRFVTKYALYIESKKIDAKLSLCTSEIATPIHPIFIDLDATIPLGETLPLEDIVRVIQCEVGNIEGIRKTHTLAVVATTTTPQCGESGEGASTASGGTWKFGAHVVFPDTTSNTANDLLLRERSLSAIQRLLPSHLDLAAGDVYDKSVYANGKGLRMLYTHKCEIRGGGANEVKTIFDRRYFPRFALGPRGVIDKTVTNRIIDKPAYALKLFSIRSQSKLLLAPKRAWSVAPGASINRLTTREIYEYAAKIEESFRNASIVDIVQRPHDDSDLCGIVLKLDRHRYCPHIGREHNSSTLFLRVNVFGVMTAGCFCAKYGCSKWRSPRVVLPPRILKELGLLANDGFPIGFSM